MDSYTACELENKLKKLKKCFTVDDLVKLCIDDDIKLISLLHVGEDAEIKTLDFVPRDTKHLRAVLSGGERCDGSSIFHSSGISADKSDIVLRPEPSTAFMDPFAEKDEPALCVFCQHYGADGLELPQSPVTIIHRAFNTLFAQTGIQLFAHAEIEYFLGRDPQRDDINTNEDRSYHASYPQVFGQKLRRDACRILAKIGVSVKYAHSECAFIPSTPEDPLVWEQHEVELALEPLPQAALSAILTQWVLKCLAARAGMRYDGKPINKPGHPGSGLHVHMSPYHPNDFGGQHLMIRNEDDKLHPAAIRLIAGLTQLGGALMAFGNREASSFIRLHQAHEAPSIVNWGDRNRKALIRLPLVAKTINGDLVAPPTIEFRLGDGSAHPYLLMAGLAQAMLYGYSLSVQEAEQLVRDTDANSSTSTNGHAAAAPVPKDFNQVATELERFKHAFAASDVFPKPMLDSLVKHYRAKFNNDKK
uniref:Lengsin n=1 Tax=Aureoumbra lagunensis TaxID=44058 RepID=A0A7S3NPW6_9STRA|mmetsp:Transcript_9526/g.14619  ORF Transcript_9526/g.14619 Transcript_9526/m.14619 type:complete len:475 (-) Transcript_9526:29-1453(-)